jgi:hypothetical protein
MDSAKKQYAKGQPYRAAVSGLLSGDTSALQELNRPSPVMPNEALDIAMTFAPMGITAFHGSPYRFDKFDPTKIGSGEGAQAYGHGLYFAESPKVAESYSKIEPAGAIASPRRTIFGKEAEPSTPEYKAAQLVDELGLSKAKKFANNWVKNSRPDEIDYSTQINNILSSVNKKSEVKNLGTSNLYKVDIADEAIPKMLDFEKPLYKQSQAVKEIALEYMPALQERLKFTGGDGVFGLTGSDLFGIMQRYQPGSSKTTKNITGQDVTNKLMSKGIPGSRYLDQSSRVEGKGTSNYVVFDPEKIKILERNGLLTN